MIVSVIAKIRHCLRILVQTKSKEKERTRREFILYILLLGSLLLSFVALLTSWIRTLSSHHGIRFESLQITVVFFFFLLCYFIARKGASYSISFLLIGFYLLITISVSLRWGAEVPMALLVYALIVVMSGILIGSRFSFFVTTFISVVLVTLIFCQSAGYLPVYTYWKTEPETITSGIVFSLALFIIALVSWLFNRESERALNRARISERALKRQRDMLEMIVEKRTQQIKQLQVEKMMQLHRFTEMGRFASGLFHDLANPLNLISLNLDEIRKKPGLETIEAALERALDGTKTLESFLQTARKQIANQEVLELFSVREEMIQAKQMLEPKAKQSQVHLRFVAHEDISFFGNPLKFLQVLVNLISNAIDAYDESPLEKKSVNISLKKMQKQLFISVEDTGSGIDTSHIGKVYDPLFTTKSIEKGTGIGLTLTKRIVEKDFKGKISFISKQGKGTTFSIMLPLQGASKSPVKKKK